MNQKTIKPSVTSAEQIKLLCLESLFARDTASTVSLAKYIASITSRQLRRSVGMTLVKWCTEQIVAEAEGKLDS